MFLFSSLIFTTNFSVFLSLIAFVHVTSLLYPDSFLSGTSLFCCTTSATDLRELYFYSQMFFSLHSFPTFGTTRFYQGFSGSRQFFLEVPLQINIIPLSVTMNRKIRKPPVKVNFRRSE